MGLRANKTRPALRKVLKKPGFLKGTGDKHAAVTTKFLVIIICRLWEKNQTKFIVNHVFSPGHCLRFDTESLQPLVSSAKLALEIRISTSHFCTAWFPKCSPHILTFGQLTGWGWKLIHGSPLAGESCHPLVCQFTALKLLHMTSGPASPKVWR